VSATPLTFASCTWEFLNGTWRVADPSGPSPPPYVGAGFVWDPAGGYALLFGNLDYATAT
jgi:hypothetical protein